MNLKGIQLGDRVSKLLMLVVIMVIVQIVYTDYVRPGAEKWVEEQRAIAAVTPGYRAERSLLVVIRDAEQQAVITVSIWAFILAFMRIREVGQHRKEVKAGYMQLPSGVVILPRDSKEYLRSFEQLPPKQRDHVLPRVLAAALKRFGATGNIQDASQTVHNMCESEINRLDAELAILRFSVWVTPALGFVGTVRGIGLALQGAELAVEGDVTAVTGGLGISFNSTLVALILSIFLMFILHEIQLMQERVVIDAENYAEDELISRLRGA